MKPLQQLFGLSVIKIWEKQNKTIAIKNYKSEVNKLERECGEDFELFMKKKEKISSMKVKILLFDDILRKINNEKANMKSISNYFN